ncbi:Translation initiation factor IF-2 [Candidatus Tremblaya princeps]|uniref:Translation initiation factor IF-2 n=1 Tax=Tremblaya princeps TaxID=189385 RepID=A0A143WP99_TREPR|nr:Translation initiation factor IF-2 [Candidatus Tremblaya princeps]
MQQPNSVGTQTSRCKTTPSGQYCGLRRTFSLRAEKIVPMPTGTNTVPIEQRYLAGAPAGFAAPAHRPAVVVFAGHVDHGKTTLMSALAGAGTAHSEAGGITQNVWAYDPTDHGAKFVLVDTPGHSAFAPSSRRGIALADIVVLVVAADSEPDERSVHSVLAAVGRDRQLVVAITKADRDAASTGARRVLRRCEALISAGKARVRPRFVSLSAQIGSGMQEMMQALRAVSCNLRLFTVRGAPAHGVILDATVSGRAGVEVTMLVQMGELSIGDRLTIRGACGCIRSLTSTSGSPLNRALPYSVVVAQCMALAPLPGLRFMSTERRQARQQVYMSTYRWNRTPKASATRYELAQRERYVVRARNHALLGAALRVIRSLPAQQPMPMVVRAGLGPASPSDAALAAATGAAIITIGMAEQSKRSSCEPCAQRFCTVYELRSALIARSAQHNVRLTSPDGRACVVRLFCHAGRGAILGCRVLYGTIRAACHARILRSGAEVGRCEIGSLRLFSEDVMEVQCGAECGVCAQCIRPTELELSAGDELVVHYSNCDART